MEWGLRGTWWPWAFQNLEKAPFAGIGMPRDITQVYTRLPTGLHTAKLKFWVGVARQPRDSEGQGHQEGWRTWSRSIIRGLGGGSRRRNGSCVRRFGCCLQHQGQLPVELLSSLMAAKQGWRRPQEMARLGRIVALGSGQYQERVGSPARDLVPSPSLVQKDVAIEANPSFPREAGDQPLAPCFAVDAFVEDGSHRTGGKSQVSLTSTVNL